MPSEHLEAAIQHQERAGRAVESDLVSDAARRTLGAMLDTTNCLIAAVQRLEQLVEGKRGIEG